MFLVSFKTMYISLFASLVKTGTTNAYCIIKITYSNIMTIKLHAIYTKYSTLQHVPYYCQMAITALGV